MTPSPAPTPPGGTGAADFELPANADDAVAAVAGNRPRPGSVTQSSNGANNVTTDHVEATMTFGPGNAPRVTVTNTPDSSASGWTVDSAEATGDDIRVTGTRMWFITPETGGRRWIGLRTDRESQADTDYLVFGIWAYLPDDEARVEDLEVGVFADGDDPFAGASLTALTGTAEYRGESNGIYSYPDSESPGGRAIDFFEADALLTANFGAADAAGTISGRITDPEVEGDPVGEPGEIVVELSAAPIGTGDGGFFAGAASMEFNGLSHAGQWGGEFFGNGAAGPGSVAGTFGVTATSPTLGRATLVGAFGATR